MADNMICSILQARESMQFNIYLSDNFSFNYKEELLLTLQNLNFFCALVLVPALLALLEELPSIAAF
jgi:hypothetical protein